MAPDAGGTTEAPDSGVGTESPPASEEPPKAGDDWGSEPAVDLGGLHLAVLGSAAKVRPEGRVEGAPRVRLVAARNEFESFQVAVSATDEALRGLTVATDGPLEGPGGALIPEGNLTVYRVGYYTVRTPSDLEGAPGRWPDPLIPTVDRVVGEPRNAFPVDVPRGENRVAWVDVQVPVDAPAGVYRGSLVVRAQGHVAHLPVALMVLELTLPSTPRLRSAFRLVHSPCKALGLQGCETSDGVTAARSLFVRVALDNRMSISNPHATSLVGSSERGLAEFRKHILPFLQGTAPTRLPGARLTSYQMNELRAHDVAGWRREARAQGFEDRAFIYACDEPHFFPNYDDPAGNWARCRAELDAFDAAWPEAPKLVTAHIQSVEAHGMAGRIDIMVLNVELLDGPPGTRWFEGDQSPRYRDFLADPTRPRELWLYTACGSHGCTRNNDPYSTGFAGYDIDAPASETRAMAWLAFLSGATGTLYYDTILQLATAWDDQYRYTGNGEGTLFYPGTPERIGGTHPIPIESLRMKLVRDGYEDYEYLKALEDAGQGAEARRLARELFPAAYQTNRTDAEVQAARLELARRVATVTGGPRP